MDYWSIDTYSKDSFSKSLSHLGSFAAFQGPHGTSRRVYPPFLANRRGARGDRVFSLSRTRYASQGLRSGLRIAVVIFPLNLH